MSRCLGEILIFRKKKSLQKKKICFSRPFVNSSYDFGNICYKHPDNIEVQVQQPQISRNLSAILDDNNTVICYLEPLPKN